MISWRCCANGDFGCLRGGFGPWHVGVRIAALGQGRRPLRPYGWRCWVHSRGVVGRRTEPRSNYHRARIGVCILFGGTRTAPVATVGRPATGALGWRPERYCDSLRASWSRCCRATRYAVRRCHPERHESGNDRALRTTTERASLNQYVKAGNRIWTWRSSRTCFARRFPGSSEGAQVHFDWWGKVLAKHPGPWLRAIEDVAPG